MNAAVRQIKPPPHSVAAEQSLLGCVMLDPKALARVANLVSDADFYRPDHRELWTVICDVQRDGLAADSVTLVDRVERAGKLGACGGTEYVAQMMADTPSASNVESYAKIVREHAVKRRLGTLGSAVGALMHSDSSASEALQQAARLFGEANGASRVGRGLVESQALVSALLDDLDRRRAGQRGLSIGLPDFDNASIGLEPGDLVVFAGRPGMGKTALLVSIAAHASRATGVAVFSAEMPASQLMRRSLALLSGLSQSKLRHPQGLEEKDWERIGEASAALARRRLWVDDTAAPSLDHIRSEVLALRARSEVGLVMVDYVQLVQGAGGNRYEQLRDVSYGLKALAKEAALPIVLLAQLNRGVDHRDEKRPRLADMRDSGAIEEAADIVGLLYSEGYYDPAFQMPYVIECSIEKNRNGERCQCLWHFSGETSRVGALDDQGRQEYRKAIMSTRSRGDDF